MSESPIGHVDGFEVFPFDGDDPDCPPVITAHAVAQGATLPHEAWIAEPVHPLAWYRLKEDHVFWHALCRYTDSLKSWFLPRRMLHVSFPAVMAIWNLSQNSFSSEADGDGAASFAHAERLIMGKASILDVGAEATNPTAKPVGPAMEQARLEPALQWLQSRMMPVSLDSFRPETIQWAARAQWIDIVNDIGGPDQTDERYKALFHTVREYRLGCILMAWHAHDHAFDAFDACMEDICRQLDKKLGLAFACGVDMGSIVVDPGIGFGKGMSNDLRLIREAAPALRGTGRPVLVAHSRKRCLGYATGRAVEARDAATAIASAIAFQAGAKMVRVHQPEGAWDAKNLLTAIQGLPENRK